MRGQGEGQADYPWNTEPEEGLDLIAAMEIKSPPLNQLCHSGAPIIINLFGNLYTRRGSSSRPQDQESRAPPTVLARRPSLAF